MIVVPCTEIAVTVGIGTDPVGGRVPGIEDAPHPTHQAVAGKTVNPVILLGRPEMLLPRRCYCDVFHLTGILYFRVRHHVLPVAHYSI